MSILGNLLNGLIAAFQSIWVWLLPLLAVILGVGLVELILWLVRYFISKTGEK